jgi:hypothetical protein
LAGAFAVASGDDRRVDVEEAALVVEAVDRHAQGVADAGDGAEGVGADAEVGELAEELERVGLGLDRIVIGIVDPADDFDFRFVGAV